MTSNKLNEIRACEWAITDIQDTMNIHMNNPASKNYMEKLYREFDYYVTLKSTLTGGV